MRRTFLIAISLVAAPVFAAPEDAVVRQISHGASCTVIASEAGQSYLLGCAHAYTDRFERSSEEARRRPIVLDLPWSATFRPANPHAHPRLIRINYDLDLSLVELPDGPLPFVCPVAPAGSRPIHLISVGYDEMKWPRTARYVTPVASEYWDTTYTRERPWHGRSGGALIDVDSGRLVGVVQGYEVDYKRRGMYISLAAIRSFLGDCGSPLPRQPPAYRYSLPPSLPIAPQPLCPH
jgi:hypothetical protein